MSITVGQVSGIIAFVAVVVHILVPLLAVIVFVGFLSSENTAATWSVVNRQIQSTLWPIFLRADSTNTRNVARRVRVLTLLRSAVYVIISVAAFVTPLGLKDAIKVGEETTLQFQYINDNSSFKFGTPPRYSQFARLCGYMLNVNCPGSFGGMATFSNATGWYEIPTTPDAIINTTIPSNYLEMFSSATSSPGTTLSGLFDIQYRVWSVSVDEKSNIDGGKPYATGTYRGMDNMILSNGVVLIEGVVADMTNGGVGYRNHTVPSNIPYGATWSEDLTWVEPITECVDTNLTIQFHLGSEDSEPSNVSLVDNGGFTNLAREYPEGLWNDRQNPDLRARAYKGAWINNALTAIYLNVTRPGDLNQMNSSIGQRFTRAGSGLGFSPKLYSTQFGQIDGGYMTFDTPSLDATATTITADNFTDASIICQGWGIGDLANYTNTGIYCGYLYGNPQSGASNPLVFEPMRVYTQNIYVCATALRQKVKTINFLANGTSDVSQLHVTSITDKVYTDNSSMPMWAIENSNWTIEDVAPVWGMVDKRFENTTGFDTLRAEQFYLPATSNKAVSGLGSATDSLAQARAFQEALYSIYPYQGAGNNFFSGSDNLALSRVWSELSSSPITAATIIDLIWTQIVATATVGIKTVTTDSSNNNGRSATPYVHGIAYHWPYAIPAFLVLVVLLGIMCLAFFVSLTSRFSLRILRQLLNQTATGRIATSLLYPTVADPAAATKTWAATAGKTPLMFAVVEKEKTGQEIPGAASSHVITPSSTTNLSFPRVGAGNGDYIMMKENPNDPR
ncbi:hypothetical protein BGW36DRAFT_348467 [Talaromyces proteolyticus]|uniref:Uncharacterized protein n=1 Tax=Talaromyces proteolyticus TaxID=1131652 RepID=A0AAD4PX53_9EURO|nr:uncharacterized protein BGW36DRAFT_348467 [Talaromyces proteolyticus]KAH8692249.1 hypothetical protein BGW36DRAFT_348467 [Talaromyces proteolyticus]